MGCCCGPTPEESGAGLALIVCLVIGLVIVWLLGEINLFGAFLLLALLMAL